MIRTNYEERMSPHYDTSGADLGWISASSPKPAHLAGEGDMGIEAAQQAPATREFNMGVLQT